MSELKTSNSGLVENTIQEKPTNYETLNLKELSKQISVNTNTQKLILKILDEHVNDSKLEKILSGVQSDLKNIIKASKNNSDIGKELKSLSAVKSKTTQLQAQLNKISQNIEAISQKKNNKTLKKEEKEARKQKKAQEKEARKQKKASKSTTIKNKNGSKKYQK
ncbi:MAG: hypothetical protein ACPKPY_00165 [Nitrososphaeraceae archaeon]